MTRQRSPAPAAIRQHLVSLIQKVLRPKLLEQPPHGLYVFVGVRHVRLVVVEPIADPIRQGLPIALVPEHTLPASAIELRHSESFDITLAVEVERLLDLDLHRKSVGIPPRDPGDRAPFQRVVTAHEVFDGTGEHMMDTGSSVSSRWTLIEHERRCVLRRLERLAKQILLPPLLEDFSLQLVGRTSRKTFVRHQLIRSNTALTNRVRSGSAAAAVAMMCATSTA